MTVEPHVRTLRGSYRGGAVYLSTLAIALTVLASPRDVEKTRKDIQSTFGLCPAFIDAVPESALPGAWRAMKAIQLSPNTAIPDKYKDLIGLAVAAQTSCAACAYFHTEGAKFHGASDKEIKEAVGMAALAREWSTLFNGALLDKTRFRAEIGRMSEGQKGTGGAGEGTGGSGKAGELASPDARARREAIRDQYGDVPEFIEKVPDAMLPGLMDEWEALEMSDSTAIPIKYKSLVSLAVAAQIPCEYCVFAHRLGAKKAGATEAELNEAVAVSALVGHWSIYLDSAQIDQKQFRSDVQRIYKNASAQQGPLPAKKKR